MLPILKLVCNSLSNFGVENVVLSEHLEFDTIIFHLFIVRFAELYVSILHRNIHEMCSVIV